MGHPGTGYAYDSFAVPKQGEAGREVASGPKLACMEANNAVSTDMIDSVAGF